MNAQAGAINDSDNGFYDPEGLVAQLEVVGQSIQKDWAAATSSKEVAAAAQLAALGFYCMMSAFFLLFAYGNGALCRCSEFAITESDNPGSRACRQ